MNIVKLKLGLVGTDKDFPSLAFNSTIINSPIISCLSSAIPSLNIDNIQTFKDSRLNLVQPMKSSFGYFKKPFKSIFAFNKLNYGDCSLTVECETVALETWVRLPPFAFMLNENKKEENIE